MTIIVNGCCLLLLYVYYCEWRDKIKKSNKIRTGRTSVLPYDRVHPDVWQPYSYAYRNLALDSPFTARAHARPSKYVLTRYPGMAVFSWFFLRRGKNLPTNKNIRMERRRWTTTAAPLLRRLAGLAGRPRSAAARVPGSAETGRSPAGRKARG